MSYYEIESMQVTLLSSACYGDFSFGTSWRSRSIVGGKEVHMCIEVLNLRQKQAPSHSIALRNFLERNCSYRRRRHITQRSTTTSSVDNTTTMSAVQSVQCFGKKKTATAVAHTKQGKGLIKVNGKPLSLVEPQILRFKVYEPLLILGLDKFGT